MSDLEPAIAGLARFERRCPKFFLEMLSFSYFGAYSIRQRDFHMCLLHEIIKKVVIKA